MLTYTVGGLYLDIAQPGSDDGWRGSGNGSEYYITGADKGAPARVLRAGDRILAINGVSLTVEPNGLTFSDRVPPGTPFTMTVLREGKELTFALQTIPRRPAPFPWGRLIPPLFWFTGLFVFLLKPEDRQARLLALMLGSFSGLLAGNLRLSSLPDWLGLLIGAARISGFISLPLLLHLFLVFPAENSLLKRWPRLMIWVYTAYCLVVLPTFGASRLPLKYLNGFFSSPIVKRLMELKLSMIAMIMVDVCLLAALICLIWSYRAADTAGRRRLRVVFVGTMLGFGSLLIIVLMEAFNLQGRFKSFSGWLDFSTLFTLPLVPVSFAYAIVRHRVIPISLMLRRGVRYLLVSRGSVILVMAGLSVILFFLIENVFRVWRPTNGRIIGIVSSIVAIVFWRVARAFHERVIAPAIDRRFFRQAYDSQQILTELTESLRTTTDIPTLLEAVGTRLQSALQTEGVTIFLREEETGAYRSAYSRAFDPASGRAVRREFDGVVPKYSAALARIADTGEMLELDGRDAGFDLAGPAVQLTAEERQTLLAANAVLLLPLKTKDGMPGVVALGSRLGDVPFSGDDKRLLQSVGAAASLAMENARLVDRMLAAARRTQEIEAENEQRARELEEARQLQLSMLPRSVPQLPTLEIAAFMQTATQVGGDYYDFHLDADGTLTIAIGDATGHGLKAGTVVTATKSLFKHLARQADVVTTMQDASFALKQMNLRSMFMALTLVRVNGDRLHYSVAGMPPILIYRHATRTVEELSLRGVPLGGLSNYSYREAEIDLAPNDVMLLMSDGLPERFNPRDEMFDYDRTRAAFLDLAADRPQAIIEGFLQTSEAWAQGRPLDDDLTLVVLKRREDPSRG
jgi:sigma-B regulation protein RsbU (phosphoserine phosphatase)